MMTMLEYLDDYDTDEPSDGRIATAAQGPRQRTSSERHNANARFRRGGGGGSRHNGSHRRRNKRNYL